METSSSSSEVPPPPEPEMERPAKQRRFGCDFAGCEYVAGRLDHLVTHKRTHTGEKPYACDVEGCDFRCTQSSALVIHKRSHTGSKPYACDFEGCDYRCTQSGNLVYHKGTHTGSKPYACDVEGCDFRCSRSYTLMTHRRTHTGSKPYACDFEGCDYRCTQSGYLASHKRTHTGTKLHACDFEGCDYRCTQSVHLVIHKRTHTGEKPYGCDVEGCDYRGTTSSHLKQHKQTWHTERGQQQRKKREEQVARFLTEAGIAFERETCVNFCGDAEKKYARVDFVCYFEDRVVCLEVDEDQHAHYGVACDVARMLNIAAQHTLRSPLPLHFIRFNPDAWRVDGQKEKTLCRQRHSWILRELLRPVQDFTITYLCYDMADGRPAVLADGEFPEELKRACRW